MSRWKFLFAALALVAVAFWLAGRGVSPRDRVPGTDRALASVGTPTADPAAQPGQVKRIAAAEGMPDRVLFAYARPVDAPSLDAALPAPSRKINYVRLNHALIDGKGSPFWQRPGEGRVQLPLPDGSMLTVVIDGSEQIGPDRFTSHGRIEGHPGSRAVFAGGDGFLSGSIDDVELGSYALRPATGELAQFYQVDPVLVLPCGGERRPFVDGAVMQDLLEQRAREAAAARGAGDDAGIEGATTAAAVNPQHAEVHLLMLYTPALLPTLLGGSRVAAIQSTFDAAVAKVNVNLADSQVSARVKLVGLAETNYDESVSTEDKVQDSALSALYGTEDGQMDEVHARRDAAGADIVMLALSRRGESSGLAFLLDSPGDFSNPRFAFGVVQYSNLLATTVLAHELGHVFGCAHNREDAKSGPGAYPYSYGYWFYGADGLRYHDIMAYPPGRELAYFSNPNIQLPAPISARIGIAAGQPGEADTARTIEQNAFEVATFRLQTQAVPNAGTLINVATRAYVGTGEQALIGGFIVRGSQPKRMLVRAAGPALASFGVPDVLENPILQLVPETGAWIVNDDWSLQPGAADVAAAAAQAGAFAFATGSHDAALLVTLAPGKYTAIVQGANGTSGAGLVEAYEIDRGANKIVNLSTRGYADNQGREMIGGFVVEGAPGSTKRILVGVRGPTLERDYGITAAMFDPFMELRDGRGELLIQNDDWTSGAQFSGGQRDDFKPTVVTYSEQQIFATGFAPSNRREPCVMVDLPPGSYTAIVKPFELRDSNPDLDQPAQPGVAIVEVYEIDP